MKGNVWLAGYIVLSLLAIGGAGFYAFNEFGNYRERFDGWNSRTSRIARLEKKVPTPSPENEERFQQELQNYEDKVDALFGSLNQFQRPLDTTLNLTDFPNILKKKVDDFKTLAGQNKVNLSNLDKDNAFFMGMERYRDVLPKQEITPLLSYQLDAIERILTHMVESKVAVIGELNREMLPGEEDAPGTDPNESSENREVVQKYPVQFRFEGSHKAFRTLLNRLANDEEYFFIVRVLAVQNSAPEGPTLAQKAVVYIDAATGQQVPEDEAEAALAGLVGEPLQIKLEDLGWEAVQQDAAILFGEETLNIFAVIDIARFMPPDENEEETSPGGTGSGDDNS